MRHGPRPSRACELCGVRRPPSAVPSCVRVAILKAALTPLTGVALRQEGEVVRIRTLAYLTGVLPIVSRPAPPARWTSSPVWLRGPGVASSARFPAGGGGCNGGRVDWICWVCQLLLHPPIEILIDTFLVRVEGVAGGQPNCQHSVVHWAKGREIVATVVVVVFHFELLLLDDYLLAVGLHLVSAVSLLLFASRRKRRDVFAGCWCSFSSAASATRVYGFRLNHQWFWVNRHGFRVWCPLRP